MNQVQIRLFSRAVAPARMAWHGITGGSVDEAAKLMDTPALRIFQAIGLGLLRELQALSSLGLIECVGREATASA